MRLQKSDSNHHFLMHSTYKKRINKAICRFKHERKEDEFHAKRMEKDSAT